tara:strand:- start:1031 stop:1228 length:198 start_codon:yes stop_codon:yes gene_type:complete
MIISVPEAALAVAEGRTKIIEIRSSAEWKTTGIPDGAHIIDINNPRGVGPSWLRRGLPRIPCYGC